MAAMGHNTYLCLQDLRNLKSEGRRRGKEGFPPNKNAYKTPVLA